MPVYGAEKEIGAMTDDECNGLRPGPPNAGRCLASEAFSPFIPLRPVGGSATEGVHQGRPFTETKECLAGFYLIDAAT